MGSICTWGSIDASRWPGLRRWAVNERRLLSTTTSRIVYGSTATRRKSPNNAHSSGSFSIRKPFWYSPILDSIGQSADSDAFLQLWCPDNIKKCVSCLTSVASIQANPSRRITWCRKNYFNWSIGGIVRSFFGPH